MTEKIEKSKIEATQNKTEVEKIEKQLNFSSSERKLVETAKQIVWFRTYRTEAMYHIYSNIENLLQEIGKRYGYSLEQMQFLTTVEIFNLPKEKISREMIEKRQSGFAVTADHEKISLLYGQDYKALEELFEEKSTAKELQGRTACKGKISGIARIVLTSKELDKVQVGDILITNMTTPDFVPAMHRAAAFVTNEGGITCHAAIISREMNKPCVIATKIATKVFKDGDLVEVDANLGIVRKLPQR